MTEVEFPDFLSIKLVPSLQHITATRICIELYLRDSFLEILGKQKDFIVIDYKVWAKQKKVVNELISELNLWGSLKRKISSFTSNVEQELIEWIKTNEWLQYRPDYGDSTGTFPLAVFDYMKNCLVWSSRGLIQYEETARNILRSEYVTKEETFYLACTYCFSEILSERYYLELREYKSSEMFCEKPMVCYWAFRFFPEIKSRFKNHLLLNSNDDNVDRRLMCFVRNRATRKYLFERLDVVVKDQAIGDYFPVELLSEFLSQLSVRGRKEYFQTGTQLSLLLITNVVWQDYMMYYFSVCKSSITAGKFLNFLQNLLFSRRSSFLTFCSSRKLQRKVFNYADVFTCEWKKSFVYDLWRSLSEDFRKEIIHESLFDLLEYIDVGVLRYFNIPFKRDSVLMQILTVLLYFNDNHLIGEILQLAQNRDVRLEICDKFPHLNAFSVDKELFKYVMFYSWRCRDCLSLQNNHFCIIVNTTNKRLYLVDRLVSTVPKTVNLLKNEGLEERIIDIFMEYFRSRLVKNIDDILDYYFENSSEKTAFKLSLLRSMFSKLLVNFFGENDYFSESSNRHAITPVRDDRVSFVQKIADHVYRGCSVIHNDSDIVISALNEFFNWYYSKTLEPDNFETDTNCNEDLSIIRALRLENKNEIEKTV